MIISLIVAVAENGVIGKKGMVLPWRLPADLAHFKKVTFGKPIIMGRATYETIGRPLPGRLNIIVSRDRAYPAEGCTVVSSLEAALDAAGDAAEVFIIGGGQIFEQALPLAEKMYLTRVHAEPEGDVFFRYNQTEWEESGVEYHRADQNNEYSYSFSLLTKHD